MIFHRPCLAIRARTYRMGADSLGRGHEMRKLKWLLNALLVIALMMLGVKIKPKAKKHDSPKPKTAIFRIIG